MVSVSVLISNGHEFLLRKSGGNHEEEIKYSLPSATTPTLIGAKRKIKKHVEKVGVVFFFEKELYDHSYDNDTHYVFLCHAHQYVLTPKKDDYVWLDIKNCAEVIIGDICEQSEKMVFKYINERLDIVQEVKRKINSIHDQSVVKLEFTEKLNGIQVDVITPDFRCAFSYSIVFDFISSNELEYQINWVVNQSLAPGDKSDIYLLFSETMAILLKLFLCEPVCVNTVEHYFVDKEIGGAIIAFESEGFNGIVGRDGVVNSAVSSFELFNMMMGIHGMLIGSISHHNTDNPDKGIIRCFNKQYLNCVLREEHACYYDNSIACIYLNNGVYNSSRLLSGYSFEIIDGIHGKILIQRKNEWVFYNYIDNDDWETVQKIVKKRGLTDFTLLCQSNRLYVIEYKEIWIVFGWFHHGIADLEKEEILDRNQRERALLLANREFAWKYPINYSRFEELCADLLEQVYPTSMIRLAGNANNADGGRDILVYNTDGTLYICQCKAYKKSVGKGDVRDIRDTIEFHGAAGFLLMVSSTATEPLIKHLELLGKRYKTKWWTDREIFKLLRRYPLIADRYKDILEIM